MADIYTQAELITKIKALDTKLESAIEESQLNTTQNVQMFEVAVEELRIQRDKYMTQLNGLQQKANKSGLVTLRRRPMRFNPWGF